MHERNKGRAGDSPEPNDMKVGPKIERQPSGLKPDGRPLFGRYVTLEHVSTAKYAAELYGSFAGEDADGRIWTYMGYGPFESEEQFSSWLEVREVSADPLFYAYVPKSSGKASGMGAFMRFDGANGVIEIGHIWLAPRLQKTREATESIFLMMRHAFEDLGVRRLEWKCDALNEPSRQAADRFGFEFEGIFRQHMIVKGRNRDTAWYSMVDEEWERVRAGFVKWLDPANFDTAGRQKTKLKTG